MGLLGDAKEKVAEIVVARAGKDIGAGEYGTKAAAIYKWLAGQGAVIGMALALISGALEAFQPDYSSAGIRYIGLVGAMLSAVGVLNKLYLKEPIFPPYVLEVVAHVSSVLGALGTTVTLVNEYLDIAHLTSVRWDRLDDMLELYLAAGSAACLFINRMARASGKMPTLREDAGPPKE